jgi:hypothetical protein
MLVIGLGTGVPVASADPYPLPTTGIGTVDRSIVHPGECVIFSGDGFKPGAAITIRDDGHDVGQTTADPHGRFRYKVCFSSDAHLGPHVLTASGTGANGAGRVVSAIVTLVGITDERPVVTDPAPVSGDSGGGSGGGLPFTGADIVQLVLLGVVLTALGAFLLARDNRRRRLRHASI